MNPQDSQSKLENIGHIVFNAENEYEAKKLSAHLIEAYVTTRVKEAEITLLKETAEGFQIVLETEFAKGGQAAINALLKMAEHKEFELQLTERRLTNGRRYRPKAH